MTRELRESPIDLDFDYYLSEVALIARSRGASLPRYRSPENTLQNSVHSAGLCLNTAQMKKDFWAVRCGDKKWQDVSSSPCPECGQYEIELRMAFYDLLKR